MAHIKHMLVATDLTGRSLYALKRAMQLRRETGTAGLTVIHVIEPGFSSRRQEGRHAEALAELQEWKASLVEDDRERVSINVLVGEPFATIVEEEAIHDMDLIVVGRPGKHGLKELFLGTTTERIIRFSEEPVLMVSQRPHGPYKRILVAMDFSEAATRALGCALRVATDAEIRIVHAWQTPLSAEFSSRKMAENKQQKERLRDHLQRAVENARERASIASAATPVNIVEGNPFVVMREEVGRFNADLLVMGTHSRGRLQTAMVGSLAQEFLIAGPCDVLVARA